MNQYDISGNALHFIEVFTLNIYMDNAATTRVCNEAIKAMTMCLNGEYGNPSSIHTVGRASFGILENARESVARLIGASPREVYFTSGGTEADNWAIHAAAELGAKVGKRHLISTRFEHHAVLHSLEKMEKQGFMVTLLDVHSNGLVRPEELENAIREDTAFVTIMYANNEIGTIQPISEFGAICRSRGVLFHTDAVQAAGHLPIDVHAQNIDMLSLSAHKFHGPKGTGVLYCSNNVPLKIFMEGGAQEHGKRGGTENVPAISGMSAALKRACASMEQNTRKIEAMRDRLIKALETIPYSRLNGHSLQRLPGIVNFSFDGIEGESLQMMLDQSGICVATGSACTSGSLEPSHVLLALGLPYETAHGSVRLSLSEYNTPEEIEIVIKKLPPIISRLRDMSPVWNQSQSVSE